MNLVGDMKVNDKGVIVIDRSFMTFIDEVPSVTRLVKYKYKLGVLFGYCTIESYSRDLLSRIRFSYYDRDIFHLLGVLSPPVLLSLHSPFFLLHKINLNPDKKETSRF